MSTHDPEVEAGAIALAFVGRPIRVKATPLEWWNALRDEERDLHRYRASIVLEAVDELKGISYAAAE